MNAACVPKCTCHNASVTMMNRSRKGRSTRVVKIKTGPYFKTKPRRAAIVSEMSDTDNILNLNADTDNELMKSDSESSQNTDASSNSSNGAKTPSIQMATSEMMSLLKENRDSQSSQCTKDDLLEYSRTIKKQFKDMDHRVSSNTSSIGSMASQIREIQTALELNKYEAELNKQSVLSRNLSIMGVPATENEDLMAIALKIFSLVGCKLTRENIFGCYRIKKGAAFANIFIVKINDFTVKQRILKSKSSKEVRLSDIRTSGRTPKTTIQ